MASSLMNELSGLWFVLNSPVYVFFFFFFLVPRCFPPSFCPLGCGELSRSHTFKKHLFKASLSLGMCVWGGGGVEKQGLVKWFWWGTCWLHVNQTRASQGRAGSHCGIMSCSDERENSSNWLHLSHIFLLSPTWRWLSVLKTQQRQKGKVSVYADPCS